LAFSQTLGTADNPIYWVLHTLDPAKIAAAEAICDDIFNRLGVYINVGQVNQGGQLVETLVVASGVFGILDGVQYLIATLYNPEVHARLMVIPSAGGYLSVAFVYAERSKGFQKLQDLDGKVWLSPHIPPDALSAYYYDIPNRRFTELEIKPADVLACEDNLNCIRALLANKGDFLIAWGLPPVPPKGSSDGDRWHVGDDPEMWLWDRWNSDLFREAHRGRPRDLRYLLAKNTADYGTWEDIVTRVGIVAVFGPFPSVGCVAFSEGFSTKAEDRLAAALRRSTSTVPLLWEALGYRDLVYIEDSFFDFLRELLGRPVPERD